MQLRFRIALFSIVLLNPVITTSIGHAWQISNNSSKNEYTAILAAASGKTTTGKPITLIIKCKQGKSLLGINWGGYMPRGSRMPVDLQIDSHSVISESWRVYNETDTSYTDNPALILKKITNASTLIVRSSYVNNGITSTIFKLENSTNALANIRAACSW